MIKQEHSSTKNNDRKVHSSGHLIVRAKLRKNRRFFGIL